MSEDVWVREYTLTPPGPKREIFSLEVLYSCDNGQTWVALPLRRSPPAFLKSIFLSGEWPPGLSRRLACEDGKIVLEFADLEHWDDTPAHVWRATYDPHWKWWNLEVVRS